MRQTKARPTLLWITVLPLALLACGGSTTTSVESASTTVETTTPTVSQPPTEQAGTVTTATAATPATSAASAEPGRAEISGEPLELLSEAIGSVSPRIDGYDLLTGQKIEWGGADGGPAAILLAPLADWCADCAAHIEELASYLSDNELPGGVNMLLVTSLDNPSAQHPQAAWLAERSWPIPTVVDSLDGAMTQWFGINSVPTWVLVATDGTVVEFVDGHNAVGVTLMAKIAALAN